MTWAEFQIRAYAYKRMQEKEDLRAREIAYNALIAPNADPKRLPKNKDKFWQIGHKKVAVNDATNEAIRKAQEQFIKDKKKLNG